MRIRVGVTIAAPPATVWRALESIERHVDWMSDAVSIRFTGAKTRGIGTTFDCPTKVGPFRFVDHMVVTEWEPVAVLGVEHRGAVAGRGRFTLRRRPGGRTRFTWTEELQFPRWLGGSAGALMAKPVLRAIWRRNLHRLKYRIEAEERAR